MKSRKSSELIREDGWHMLGVEWNNAATIKRENASCWEQVRTPLIIGKSFRNALSYQIEVTRDSSILKITQWLTPLLGLNANIYNLLNGTYHNSLFFNGGYPNG